MKATDFRLGNYVYGIELTPDGPVKAIRQISELIYFNSDHSSQVIAAGIYDLIEPIPLTEDWVINLGFNKFAGVYIKTRKGGQQVIIDKTTNGFKFDYGQGSNFAFLTTVNQLQNLYFALTGVELELKTSKP